MMIFIYYRTRKS